MDLRQVVKKLPERTENTLSMFEGARLVQRTFDSLYPDVKAACSRLEAWGVEPGMRVGIRAPNSYWWIVYDLALIARKAVSVAFTDDFATAPAGELVERYSLSLLLEGGPGASADATDAPVACLDHPDGKVRAVDRGPRDHDSDFEHPFLIFSSGSAGGVKGLVLNRRGVEATLQAFVQAVSPRHDDSLLLFLPMSNFQQRMMYYAAFWYGFDLLVVDPPKLLRALKDLRPTMLIAPPALYEAVANRFSNLPEWKRWAVNFISGLLLRLPLPGLRENCARRLFKQVHEAFGGRMRFMVTGMAPIKRSTLELFERVQLPLYETYGLIECGTIALNLPGARRLGSVGRLLAGVDVELAQDGEIIARRQPNISSGYFECADGEQEKTFLGGHRIATGDIGRFDADGYLYLLGRKKELIVTSGGEKVHPELLEAEIDTCPDVDKSVVFLAAEAPVLLAVVRLKDTDDTAARDRIRQHVEMIYRRRPSTSVVDVIFTDVTFSTENGFLRPNLKLDRKRITQHFQPLYAGAVSRRSSVDQGAEK